MLWGRKKIEEWQQIFFSTVMLICDNQRDFTGAKNLQGQMTTLLEKFEILSN